MKNKICACRSNRVCSPCRKEAGSKNCWCPCSCGCDNGEVTSGNCGLNPKTGLCHSCEEGMHEILPRGVKEPSREEFVKQLESLLNQYKEILSDPEE